MEIFAHFGNIKGEIGLFQRKRGELWTNPNIEWSECFFSPNEFKILQKIIINLYLNIWKKLDNL